MSVVSIIIPLFNRKELIKETLNSLQDYLHPHTSLEIIVVDDGSTDGSAEEVELNYPDVKLIRQSNAGAPAARNRGLKEAKGEYVLFLDSDDLIEPDFFRNKINTLEDNPSLAAVYGLWEHFKVVNNQKLIIPRHTPYPIISTPDYSTHLTNLLAGWYIVCHALLWRKSILIDQLNGYDATLVINQDVDLLFRCLAGKNAIMGVSSPLAEYRQFESTHRVGSVAESPKKLSTILELRKSFVKTLSENGLLTIENKKALGTFCFHTWQENRKHNPEIAREFLMLSKALYPNLQLKGGRVIQLMSRLLGAKNAAIIKAYLSK